MILLFVGYVYINADRFTGLLNVSIELIVLLIGFISAGIVLRGLINYFLYRVFNVNLTLVESTGLAVINTLANLLPLTGGLIAKGVYLKKRHQLSYSLYLPATVALFICFVSINGLIGLLGILGLNFILNTPIPLALIWIYILMTGCMGLLWVPWRTNLLPAKWAEKISQAKDGWECFRQHPRLLMNISGLQIMSIVLGAVRLFIVFKILSQDIPFVYCILFSSAIILTQLVNITPDAIGFREVLIGGLTSMVGFQFSTSIFAVAIDRLMTMFIVFLAGIFYARYFSRDTSAATSKKYANL